MQINPFEVSRFEVGLPKGGFVDICELKIG